MLWALPANESQLLVEGWPADCLSLHMTDVPSHCFLAQREGRGAICMASWWVYSTLDDTDSWCLPSQGLSHHSQA